MVETLDDEVPATPGPVREHVARTEAVAHAAAVEDLARNRDKRAAMSAAMRGLARPRAAQDIADVAVLTALQ